VSCTDTNVSEIRAQVDDFGAEVIDTCEPVDDFGAEVIDTCEPVDDFGAEVIDTGAQTDAGSGTNFRAAVLVGVSAGGTAIRAS
jgi:hypothetical protein